MYQIFNRSTRIGLSVGVFIFIIEVSILVNNKYPMRVRRNNTAKLISKWRIAAMIRIFAETLHLKSEVGRIPFPSRARERYISINMTYRGVETCFVSISQTVSRFFLFFLLFFLFFVFTPTEFTVTELDDNVGTWLVTFSLARISCFSMYNPSPVLVVLVFPSDVGTELVTIETTRRGTDQVPTL